MPEGPALPPPQPVPKASPEQPGPKASSEQPGPKTSPEGPTPEADGRPGNLGLGRQRDGSLLYVDPGKRFTAAVNPDGSVRFGNRWGRDQHGDRMRGSRRPLRQIGPSSLG